MRTIIIGDVHGCLDELDELLRQVQYTKADDLVFVGDFMDRGPDPVGVVRRVRELNARSVPGNHEESHTRFRRHEDARRATGKKNPMKPFSTERRLQNEALSDDDIAWMKSLPLTIKLGNNFIAVHGGFREGVSVDDQEPGDVIRMRYLDKDTFKPLPLEEDFEQPPNSIFWSMAWNGPENVVYGHAVMGDEPFHHIKKVEPPFEVFRDGWPTEVHTVGIDTGCVFGGMLTAMISEDDLNTWVYSQVRAKKVYYKPVAGVHKAMATNMP